MGQRTSWTRGVVPAALALASALALPVAVAQGPAARVVVLRGYLMEGSQPERPLARGSVVLVFSDNRGSDLLADTLVGEDGYYEVRFELPLGRSQVWIVESDYRCHRSFHPRQTGASRIERHVVDRLSECDPEAGLPRRSIYALRWGLSRTFARAERGGAQAQARRESARQALESASPAVLDQLRDYEGARLPPVLERRLRSEVSRAR